MFTEAAIKDIFGRFAGLRVLIVGDVMIDSYIWGSVRRLSPEAPVPIVNVTKRDNRLGGAANVARNIKALGAEPILCSCVGDDEKGDMFIRLLREEGMSASGIIRATGRPTTVKFRVIGNNAQLLRVDEETEEELTLELSDMLALHISGLLKEHLTDVVVMEDYDKGILTPDLIKKVTHMAGLAGIPVVVDPKKKHFFDYKGVNLFKPNFKEFCEGLKVELDSSDDATLCAEMQLFREKQDIETLLVSLSERGVMVSSGQTCTRVPAHLRNISDVSGAGDTLISVAALCMALGLSPLQTATLSNLAGGFVCEYVGVVPADRDKLLEEALRLLVK